MEHTAAILRKTATLSWLTGPIFDKELRISSRRKRNYFLRVAYLVLLLLILSLIWVEEIGTRTKSTVYQVSRLSQIGIMITGVIVIVQFYAAQIITVVMLSNSISDEIYCKTLGVLMSTPITPLQIICGKIFSKLLQVILLLCLTLPILGIIRVFGGVPWYFLVQSLCVTLTAVLFAGALTLNFSIHHKHAFAVIIQTVLVGLLIYILFPFFGAWISIEQLDFRENTVFQWISVINPLFMMQVLVEELFNPRSVRFSADVWGWNCLFLLVCSGLLLLRAVIIVRKKALLQACGQFDRTRIRKGLLPWRKSGKIRHVKGPPLIWKELRSTTLSGNIIKKLIFIVVVIGSILFSYYICIKEHSFRWSGPHIMYAMIYSGLSVFFTATFSATTIASEKSGRTWPILLCTQVTDLQIIAAKVIGVLRRAAPYWCILFLHILVFTGTSIHPAAFPHVFMIIVPTTFFVIASGILFSTLFKRVTSAVVVNLIFIALTWAGVPLFSAIIDAIMHMNGDLIEFVITLNPFYHLVMVLETTSGSGLPGYQISNVAQSWSALTYHWEFSGSLNFIEATVFFGIIGLAYTSISLLFLRIAKTQLRRKIF